MIVDEALLMETTETESQETLDAFCERLAPMIKARIRCANTPEEAAQEADIVVTATTSETPVLQAEWLQPGAHVNAMGANAASRMELDPAIVATAALIATDDVAQARKEAAEDRSSRICRRRRGAVS